MSSEEESSFQSPSYLEESISPSDLLLPTAEPSSSTTATQNGATAPPTKIAIYENSISFLKDACRARIPGRSLSELARFQLTLDDYLVSMSSDSIFSGIVGSLRCRKILLELSSELGLDNDPSLRKALRADGERIAALLVSIFDSQSAEDVVLRLEGDSAQCFLDAVLDILDGGFLITQEHSRKARRIIRKLSESCDKLPSALFITGVSEREEYPTFGGGYGDIYRASHNNKPVALKHLRHFLRGTESHRIRLNLFREALVWRELHHPNILPFIGIDRESFPSSLCMVSPWMEHGTILKYLEVHGHANVDKLVFEIAQGLQYLHSRNIVHGDLRGANILINEDWSACLADFELSVFSDALSMHTSTRAGSLYWMAPELIVPDRSGCRFTRTLASDVYAFGCTCIEVYTGRPPFSDLPEAVALLRTINGERPRRPSETPAMSDVLWQIVLACWKQNPVTRPTVEVVIQQMSSEALSLVMKVYMYKDCSAFLADISPNRNLRSIHCVPCPTSTDSVIGLVHSAESRKIILKLAFELGVGDDGRLQNALYNDAQHILEHVVAVIQSPEATEVALKLESESAEQFLDVVKNTLHGDLLNTPEYRSRARILIHKIYEAMDKFPSDIFIEGVTDRDRDPSFGGGYADVYRARYRDKLVALKRLRMFIQGEDPRAIRSKFRREVLVWQRLDHPHILPLIGIYREESSWSSLFMVSPWMDRGDILGHLKHTGRDDVKRLLYEIAQGLQYLHSQGVVHGDLRGQNIVVTEDRKACLVDFGLSRYSEASRHPSKEGGSTRWMAPELIATEQFSVEFFPKCASDVYAFGCVCLELCTLQPPFSNIPMAWECAVIQRVLEGKRPERPTAEPLMTDRFWQCITSYWGQDPATRPSVEVIVSDMLSEYVISRGPNKDSQSTWERHSQYSQPSSTAVNFDDAAPSESELEIYNPGLLSAATAAKVEQHRVRTDENELSHIIAIQRRIEQLDPTNAQHADLLQRFTKDLDRLLSRTPATSIASLITFSDIGHLVSMSANNDRTITGDRSFDDVYFWDVDTSKASPVTIAMKALERLGMDSSNAFISVQQPGNTPRSVISIQFRDAEIGEQFMDRLRWNPPASMSHLHAARPAVYEKRASRGDDHDPW